MSSRFRSRMNVNEINDRPTLVQTPRPAEFGQIQPLWDRLQSYLVVSIEIRDPELREMTDESTGRHLVKRLASVQLTAQNTAASIEDGPQIIFTGVGVDVVPLRAKDRAEPEWASGIKTTGPEPAVEDRYEPVMEEARNPDGRPIPLETPGDQLLPGQTIVYELWAPPNDLPYYDYRVRGHASLRHLFNYDHLMSVPEAITRPPALEAVQAFNAIELHDALKALVQQMPRFDANTRLADAEPFRPVLVDNVRGIDKLQKDLARLQRNSPNRRISALVKGAQFYLTELKNSCGRMSEALSSGTVVDICRAVQDFEFVQVIASEVNKSTEDLMTHYVISDKEGAYRYRG